jgi:hypothetical protein
LRKSSSASLIFEEAKVNIGFTSPLLKLSATDSIPPAANTSSSESHARTHAPVLPILRPNRAWPPDHPSLRPLCRLEHQLGTWGKKARKCSPAWSQRLINGRIVKYNPTPNSKRWRKEFLVANASVRSSLSESLGYSSVRDEREREDKMSSQPLLATAPGTCSFSYTHTPVSPPIPNSTNPSPQANGSPSPRVSSRKSSSRTNAPSSHG